MILFFDTETTGLPRNWGAPATDTRNWPRMVQLACLLYTPKGELVRELNTLIRPEGFTIPSEATKIHGISTQRAWNDGRLLEEVLEEFTGLLNEANLLVAHNIEFDEKIIAAEYIRKKSGNPFPGFDKICTMKDPDIINFCAIPPFRYGAYKWPQLQELHESLFDKKIEGAHDAAIDIKATAACFWELRRRKII